MSSIDKLEELNMETLDIDYTEQLLKGSSTPDRTPQEKLTELRSILKRHRLAILPDSNLNGELHQPEFQILESNFRLKTKHRKYKNKIMGGDVGKNTKMT